MSKADEMFEKLGYRKAFYDGLICFESEYDGSFEFCKEERYYLVSGHAEAGVFVDTDVGVAIYEKMKELGWLDV